MYILNNTNIYISIIQYAEIQCPSTELQISSSPIPCYTPRGSKEWIPRCSKQYTPHIGMRFSTLEEGVQFYKAYASMCGLTERMGTQKKSKETNDIYLKYIYCNKQGFNNDPTSAINQRKRSLKRAECRAMIDLRACKEGHWEVYKFVESHTHHFSSPKSMYHLTNTRELTSAHMKFIFDNSKVNIGPSRSYKMMKEHVGSFENVALNETYVPYLN